MKYVLQTYLRRPKSANKDRIRYAKTKFLLSIEEQPIYKLKNYITQEKVHRVKRQQYNSFLAYLNSVT